MAADRGGDAATAGDLGHRLSSTALVGAARRFGTLFGVAAGVTVLGSMLVALTGGSTVRRALSLGFYVVGSFILLDGFFVGNRGPFRVANEEGIVGLRISRGVRVASGEEQVESFNMTGLLVVAGIVLLALGAAVDSNARLL